MIGLVGSHRTGKTTLARAFAEDSGIPFVETSTAEVFRRLGYDPKVDYDFGTRLFLQEEILKHVERQYRQSGIVFITDRTPIDMVAYTLADVQRTNVSAEEAERLMGYIERCVAVTNRHFSALIIVQPGIPVQETEKSAPGNVAYMEHINALAMGLMVRSDIAATKHFIARGQIDLRERVQAVHAAFKKTLRRHAESVAKEAVGILH